MSKVKVAVRVRPPTQRELELGSKISVELHEDKRTGSANILRVHNAKLENQAELADSRERIKTFCFDYVYMSVDPQSENYASQEVIFEELGTEVLQAAEDGYNSCVFAYGQTGTGKTHTMMGQPNELGLIPRICEGLFSRKFELEEESEELRFNITVSFYEIYNERVRDLLVPPQTSQSQRYKLKVRENPNTGPYVEGLLQQTVKNNRHVQTCIDKGIRNRTTAATHVHERSSRSHAIFTILFEQAKIDDYDPKERKSKIHLVDLAGSERADPTTKYDKNRQKEGANINKSLVTLGNVISALAERSLIAWSKPELEIGLSSGSVEHLDPNSTSTPRKQRPLYIPYRDSVLTWLLKDSLGGNSKTIMIATVCPTSLYYNETISTLRYAQRAKCIINQPEINEDPNVQLIRELKAEIVRLRSLLDARWGDTPMASEKVTNNFKSIEIQAGSILSMSETSSVLAERLEENETKVRDLTQNFLGRWKESHNWMKDSDMSIQPLRLSGRSQSMGVIVDSVLPHLVGMSEDILQTGIMLYYLKEGTTIIGTEDAVEEPDSIVLDGPDILPEHCWITNSNGEVTIHPHHGATVTINNKPISKPEKLTQGDIVHIGAIKFRFNNPQEAAKLRERRRIAACVPLWKSMSKSMNIPEGHFISSMSRCSSYSSINTSSGIDMESPSPTPAMSLFRGPSWNDFCLEMERKYTTERERIEMARQELEQLRNEYKHEEDLRQEKEESMWRLHEEHQNEIEAEWKRLAMRKETHERERAKAAQELEETRRQIEDERLRNEKRIQEQLEQIQNLECSPKRSSRELAIQTVPDLGELAVQTESQLAMALTGRRTKESQAGTGFGQLETLNVSDQIRNIVKNSQMTIQGQKKKLVEQELIAKYRIMQQKKELQERARRIEEMFLASSEKLELERRRIEERADQYKKEDASTLEVVTQHTQIVEKIQHKETQLELYIEEKQRELEEQSSKGTTGSLSEELLSSIGSDSCYSVRSSLTESTSGVSPMESAFTPEPSQAQGGARPKLGSTRSPGNRNKVSKKAKDVTDRLYPGPSKRGADDRQATSQLAGVTPKKKPLTALSHSPTKVQTGKRVKGNAIHPNVLSGSSQAGIPATIDESLEVDSAKDADECFEIEPLSPADSVFESPRGTFEFTVLKQQNAETDLTSGDATDGMRLEGTPDGDIETQPDSQDSPTTFHAGKVLSKQKEEADESGKQQQIFLSSGIRKTKAANEEKITRNHSSSQSGIKISNKKKQRSGSQDSLHSVKSEDSAVQSHGRYPLLRSSSEPPKATPAAMETIGQQTHVRSVSHRSHTLSSKAKAESQSSSRHSSISSIKSESGTEKKSSKETKAGAKRTCTTKSKDVPKSGEGFLSKPKKSKRSDFHLEIYIPSGSIGGGGGTSLPMGCGTGSADDPFRSSTDPTHDVFARSLRSSSFSSDKSQSSTYGSVHEEVCGFLDSTTKIIRRQRIAPTESEIEEALRKQHRIAQIFIPHKLQDGRTRSLDLTEESYISEASLIPSTEFPQDRRSSGAKIFSDDSLEHNLDEDIAMSDPKPKVSSCSTCDEEFESNVCQSVEVEQVPDHTFSDDSLNGAGGSDRSQNTRSSSGLSSKTLAEQDASSVTMSLHMELPDCDSMVVSSLIPQSSFDDHLTLSTEEKRSPVAQVSPRTVQRRMKKRRRDAKTKTGPNPECDVLMSDDSLMSSPKSSRPNSASRRRRKKQPGIHATVLGVSSEEYVSSEEGSSSINSHLSSDERIPKESSQELIIHQCTEGDTADLQTEEPAEGDILMETNTSASSDVALAHRMELEQMVQASAVKAEGLHENVWKGGRAVADGASISPAASLDSSILQKKLNHFSKTAVDIWFTTAKMEEPAGTYINVSIVSGGKNKEFFFGSDHLPQSKEAELVPAILVAGKGTVTTDSSSKGTSCLLKPDQITQTEKPNIRLNLAPVDSWQSVPSSSSPPSSLHYHSMETRQHSSADVSSHPLDQESNLPSSSNELDAATISVTYRQGSHIKHLESAKHLEISTPDTLLEGNCHSQGYLDQGELKLKQYTTSLQADGKASEADISSLSPVIWKALNPVSVADVSLPISSSDPVNNKLNHDGYPVSGLGQEHMSHSFESDSLEINSAENMETDGSSGSVSQAMTAIESSITAGLQNSENDQMNVDETSHNDVTEQPESSCQHHISMAENDDVSPESSSDLDKSNDKLVDSVIQQSTEPVSELAQASQVYMQPLREQTNEGIQSGEGEHSFKVQAPDTAVDTTENHNVEKMDVTESHEICNYKKTESAEGMELAVCSGTNILDSTRESLLEECLKNRTCDVSPSTASKTTDPELSTDRTDKANVEMEHNTATIDAMAEFTPSPLHSLHSTTVSRTSDVLECSPERMPHIVPPLSRSDGMEISEKEMQASLQSSISMVSERAESLEEPVVGLENIAINIVSKEQTTAEADSLNDTNENLTSSCRPSHIEIDKAAQPHVISYPQSQFITVHYMTEKGEEKQVAVQKRAVRPERVQLRHDTDVSPVSSPSSPHRDSGCYSMYSIGRDQATTEEEDNLTWSDRACSEGGSLGFSQSMKTKMGWLSAGENMPRSKQSDDLDRNLSASTTNQPPASVDSVFSSDLLSTQCINASPEEVVQLLKELNEETESLEMNRTEIKEQTASQVMEQILPQREQIASQVMATSVPSQEQTVSQVTEQTLPLREQTERMLPPRGQTMSQMREEILPSTDPGVSPVMKQTVQPVEETVSWKMQEKEREILREQTVHDMMEKRQPDTFGESPVSQVIHERHQSTGREQTLSWVMDQTESMSVEQELNEQEAQLKLNNDIQPDASTGSGYSDILYSKQTPILSPHVSEKQAYTSQNLANIERERQFQNREGEDNLPTMSDGAQQAKHTDVDSSQACFVSPEGSQPNVDIEAETKLCGFEDGVSEYNATSITPNVKPESNLELDHAAVKESEQTLLASSTQTFDILAKDGTTEDDVNHVTEYPPNQTSPTMIDRQILPIQEGTTDSFDSSTEASALIEAGVPHPDIESELYKTNPSTDPEGYNKTDLTSVKSDKPTGSDAFVDRNQSTENELPHTETPSGKQPERTSNLAQNADLTHWTATRVSQEDIQRSSKNNIDQVQAGLGSTPMEAYNTGGSNTEVLNQDKGVPYTPSTLAISAAEESVLLLSRYDEAPSRHFDPENSSVLERSEDELRVSPGLERNLNQTPRGHDQVTGVRRSTPDQITGTSVKSEDRYELEEVGRSSEQSSDQSAETARLGVILDTDFNGSATDQFGSIVANRELIQQPFSERPEDFLKDSEGCLPKIGGSRSSVADSSSEPGWAKAGRVEASRNVRPADNEAGRGADTERASGLGSSRRRASEQQAAPAGTSPTISNRSEPDNRRADSPRHGSAPDNRVVRSLHDDSRPSRADSGRVGARPHSSGARLDQNVGTTNGCRQQLAEEAVGGDYHSVRADHECSSPDVHSEGSSDSNVNAKYGGIQTPASDRSDNVLIEECSARDKQINDDLMSKQSSVEFSELASDGEPDKQSALIDRASDLVNTDDGVEISSENQNLAENNRDTELVGARDPSLIREPDSARVNYTRQMANASDGRNQTNISRSKEDSVSGAAVPLFEYPCEASSVSPENVNMDQGDAVAEHDESVIESQESSDQTATMEVSNGPEKLHALKRAHTNEEATPPEAKCVKLESIDQAPSQRCPPEGAITAAGSEVSSVANTCHSQVPGHDGGTSVDVSFTSLDEGYLTMLHSSEASESQNLNEHDPSHLSGIKETDSLSDDGSSVDPVPATDRTGGSGGSGDEDKPEDNDDIIDEHPGLVVIAAADSSVEERKSSHWNETDLQEVIYKEQIDEIQDSNGRQRHDGDSEGLSVRDLRCKDNSGASTSTAARTQEELSSSLTERGAALSAAHAVGDGNQVDLDLGEYKLVHFKSPEPDPRRSDNTRQRQSTADLRQSGFIEMSGMEELVVAISENEEGFIAVTGSEEHPVEGMDQRRSMTDPSGPRTSTPDMISIMEKQKDNYIDGGDIEKDENTIQEEGSHMSNTFNGDATEETLTEQGGAAGYDESLNQNGADVIMRQISPGSSVDPISCNTTEELDTEKQAAQSTCAVVNETSQPQSTEFDVKTNNKHLPATETLYVDTGYADSGYAQPASSGAVTDSGLDTDCTPTDSDSVFSPISRTTSRSDKSPNVTSGTVQVQLTEEDVEQGVASKQDQADKSDRVDKNTSSSSDTSMGQVMAPQGASLRTEDGEGLETNLVRENNSLTYRVTPGRHTGSTSQIQTRLTAGDESSDTNRDLTTDLLDQDPDGEEVAQDLRSPSEKRVRFVDTQTFVMDIKPQDVSNMPPDDDYPDDHEVIFGSQSTVGYSDQRSGVRIAEDFQVFGIQPGGTSKLSYVPGPDQVLRDEPNCPLQSHLQHSSVTIEIKPRGKDRKLEELEHDMGEFLSLEGRTVASSENEQVTSRSHDLSSMDTDTVTTTRKQDETGRESEIVCEDVGTKCLIASTDETQVQSRFSEGASSTVQMNTEEISHEKQEMMLSKCTDEEMTPISGNETETNNTKAPVENQGIPEWQSESGLSSEKITAAVDVEDTELSDLSQIDILVEDKASVVSPVPEMCDILTSALPQTTHVELEVVDISLEPVAQAEKEKVDNSIATPEKKIEHSVSSNDVNSPTTVVSCQGAEDITEDSSCDMSEPDEGLVDSKRRLSEGEVEDGMDVSSTGSLSMNSAISTDDGMDSEQRMREIMEQERKALIGLANSEDDFDEMNVSTNSSSIDENQWRDRALAKVWAEKPKVTASEAYKLAELAHRGKDELDNDKEEWMMRAARAVQAHRVQNLRRQLSPGEIILPDSLLSEPAPLSTSCEAFAQIADQVGQLPELISNDVHNIRERFLRRPIELQRSLSTSELDYVEVWERYQNPERQCASESNIMAIEYGDRVPSMDSFIYVFLSRARSLDHMGMQEDEQDRKSAISRPKSVPLCHKENERLEAGRFDLPIREISASLEYLPLPKLTTKQKSSSLGYSGENAHLLDIPPDRIFGGNPDEHAIACESLANSPGYRSRLQEVQTQTDDIIDNYQSHQGSRKSVAFGDVMILSDFSFDSEIRSSGSEPTIGGGHGRSRGRSPRSACVEIGIQTSIEQIFDQITYPGSAIETQTSAMPVSSTYHTSDGNSSALIKQALDTVHRSVESQTDSSIPVDGHAAEDTMESGNAFEGLLTIWRGHDVSEIHNQNVYLDNISSDMASLSSSPDSFDTTLLDSIRKAKEILEAAANLRGSSRRGRRTRNDSDDSSSAAEDKARSKRQHLSSEKKLKNKSTFISLDAFTQTGDSLTNLSRTSSQLKLSSVSTTSDGTDVTQVQETPIPVHLEKWSSEYSLSSDSTAGKANSQKEDEPPVRNEDETLSASLIRSIETQTYTERRVMETQTSEDGEIDSQRVLQSLPESSASVKPLMVDTAVGASPPQGSPVFLSPFYEISPVRFTPLHPQMGGRHLGSEECSSASIQTDDTFLLVDDRMLETQSGDQLVNIGTDQASLASVSVHNPDLEMLKEEHERFMDTLQKAKESRDRSLEKLKQLKDSRLHSVIDNIRRYNDETTDAISRQPTRTVTEEKAIAETDHSTDSSQATDHDVLADTIRDINNVLSSPLSDPEIVKSDDFASAVSITEDVVKVDQGQTDVSVDAERKADDVIDADVNEGRSDFEFAEASVASTNDASCPEPLRQEVPEDAHDSVTEDRVTEVRTLESEPYSELLEVYMSEDRDTASESSGHTSGSGVTVIEVKPPEDDSFHEDYVRGDDYPSQSMERTESGQSDRLISTELALNQAVQDSTAVPEPPDGACPVTVQASEHSTAEFSKPEIKVSSTAVDPGFESVHVSRSAGTAVTCTVESTRQYDIHLSKDSRHQDDSVSTGFSDRNSDVATPPGLTTTQHTSPVSPGDMKPVSSRFEDATVVTGRPQPSLSAAQVPERSNRPPSRCAATQCDTESYTPSPDKHPDPVNPGRYRATLRSDQTTFADHFRLREADPSRSDGISTAHTDQDTDIQVIVEKYQKIKDLIEKDGGDQYFSKPMASSYNRDMMSTPNLRVAPDIQIHVSVDTHRPTELQERSQSAPPTPARADMSTSTTDESLLSPSSTMIDEAVETECVTSDIDTELERLKRERQRILDMLAKDQMPSKLQVELAEAQLNYLIGQTDTLLSALDEPSWDVNSIIALSAPEEQLSEISKQYLARYRETLERSRIEIENRIDRLQKKQHLNDRSRERHRQYLRLQRNIQKEAFLMERRREQVTYETISKMAYSKSVSPTRSRLLARTRSPESQSVPPPEPLKADFLRPKQRVTYLTQKRRGLVESTQFVDHDRLRSASPALSMGSASSLLSPGSYSAGLSAATSRQRSSLSSPHTSDIDDILKRYDTRARNDSESYYSVLDRLDVASITSSLDEDTHQLLTDYQSARGQTRAEIQKAKESLSKRPVTKPVTRTPLVHEFLPEDFTSTPSFGSGNDPDLERNAIDQQGIPPGKVAHHRRIDKEIEELKQRFSETSRHRPDEFLRSSSSRIMPERRDFLTSTPQRSVFYDPQSSVFSERDLLMMTDHHHYYSHGLHSNRSQYDVSSLTNINYESIFKHTRPVNAADIKAQIVRERKYASQSKLKF